MKIKRLQGTLVCIPTTQEVLYLQPFWMVSEAYDRALVAERQEKRKFMRSRQQYQGGSKFRQPFHSYSKVVLLLVVNKVVLPDLIIKITGIKLQPCSKSAPIQCFGGSKPTPKQRFKCLSVGSQGISLQIVKSLPEVETKSTF